MKISRLISARRAVAASEDYWIPLSDLMTGLMMIFMLVAIVFMVKVEAEKDHVEVQRKIAEDARSDAERKEQLMRDVAEKYYEIRTQLFDDLQREFATDLPRWKAKLDPDLTIRFEEPDVLFDQGKAELKQQFKDILSDFFPRYVRIIGGEKYRGSIEEVRIEGHTSTNWSTLTSRDEAYFRNMDLSQSRTRSALQYVLLLPQLSGQKPWLTARLTANGLSSSRPRLQADGVENEQASRRVEFRVRTDADARIGEILKAARR